jgi:hypothetical protein
MLDVTLCSNYKLKVLKEKAFLISQVLDETRLDVSSSALGLDGFRKLIKEVKGAREEADSGENLSRLEVEKKKKKKKKQTK